MASRSQQHGQKRCRVEIRDPDWPDVSFFTAQIAPCILTAEKRARCTKQTALLPRKKFTFVSCFVGNRTIVYKYLYEFASILLALQFFRYSVTFTTNTVVEITDSVLRTC